jgi:hypothetical protein
MAETVGVERHEIPTSAVREMGGGLKSAHSRKITGVCKDRPESFFGELLELS